MVEHGDAVREFSGMMIGKQEPAGTEANVLGLQEGLRQQQVRRRMRLPRRGMMLADPGLLIAELIQPSQHLKVEVVTLFQSAFRRMRGHREISEFHGAFLWFDFFGRVVARGGKYPPRLRLNCDRRNCAAPDPGYGVDAVTGVRHRVFSETYSAWSLRNTP